MDNNLKTFDDLVFKDHPNQPTISIIAKMFFDNGRGVSVINGDCAYTNGPDEYEVAILGPNGSLDYSTPLTDDVIGHQSPEQVTEIMKAVQMMPVVD